MEPAVVGAIAGAVVASLAVLGFWMNLSDRISKAHSAAEAALQVAAESEEAVKECHERVTTLSANFSLYREQAIREFVSHNTITEVEKRLVESQAKTEQRLVDALDGLNKRLDRLIEAGLQRHQRNS